MNTDMSYRLQMTMIIKTQEKYLKKKKKAYRTFVVPATQEAEAEGSLGPSVSRPAWATS